MFASVDDVPSLQELLLRHPDPTSTKARNAVAAARTKINRLLDDLWNKAHVVELTSQVQDGLRLAHQQLVEKRNRFDNYLDHDFHRVVSGGEDVLGVGRFPLHDAGRLTTPHETVQDPVIWGPGADESESLHLPGGRAGSPSPSFASSASSFIAPSMHHSFQHSAGQGGLAGGLAGAATLAPPFIPNIVVSPGYDISRTPTPGSLTGTPRRTPLLAPTRTPSPALHVLAGAPQQQSTLLPVAQARRAGRALLRSDGKSPEPKDHFKVFVGGFARGTTAEQFRAALQQQLGIAPAPGQIKIMFQNPHRHGFVQCLALRSVEDADRLIQASPLAIAGQQNPLEVKPYLSRRQYRRAKQTMQQQRRLQRGHAFIRQASG